MTGKPKQQGDFHADFERLTQSFEAIAKIPSPTCRRFTLNRIAPVHALPKAECRALFKAWLLEKSQKSEVAARSLQPIGKTSWLRDLPIPRSTC